MTDTRPQNRSSEEMAMRGLLVAKLREMWPDGRIIHELPLRYSTNRIDLAVVRSAEIIGVEIKSSRDVATRLEAQLRAFAPICSRLIVALAPKWNEQRPHTIRPAKHGSISTPNLTEAQAAVARVGASHIRTWTVCADSGTIDGDSYWYRSVGNDLPWAGQMLDMLRVAELAEIMVRHGWQIGPRPTHYPMVRQLGSELSGRQVVEEVCRALRARDAFAKESDPPVSRTVEAVDRALV